MMDRIKLIFFIFILFRIANYFLQHYKGDVICIKFRYIISILICIIYISLILKIRKIILFYGLQEYFQCIKQETLFFIL
ncbi:MAG: hypothetical protein C0412_14380 [Flavobacterium sp.]|nr:hypothetical protein [Flavobacterium sp.]